MGPCPPVNVQLIVDNLSDGLSICCRAGQSTVDPFMKRRQFVHHSVHHRLAVQGDKQRELLITIIFLNTNAPPHQNFSLEIIFPNIQKWILDK